jgi:hypothetical protein
MQYITLKQENEIIQATSQITRIADRMGSPSRMATRNPVADAEDMIRQARAIIEIAERIKNKGMSAPQLNDLGVAPQYKY